ncbi:DNA replication regulator SLD3 domain-containing protein [Hirsutella rhossiliensis]|uniref:DNA replication regulator SLD3 domain-containing protein n=1 Tax=Hirsutella rhossiliensis TaxID=111463 RepID=A0A9P8MVY2_9HYPO|nr:DNA replication regulator SLD3 domain-containing protein [Hirsutella rhossiliensis]KAH0963218.1 DNA replication regulator SLD3 domain-containing protein [Hirsutella rhossiliensis]
MSSPPALGADASRPRSGILTPTSEGSLNRDHGARGASPGGHGTKMADTAAMDDLMKPSIAVKPYPPKLHVQPRLLLPLMLLPREHLPLACIDFTAIDHGQPRSRFYESHVKILDLESRLGSAPSVLIARNEPAGTVYALERQGNGLYVMCQLGPWVDLTSLAVKATAVSHQRLRRANPERRGQDTVRALTTPQIHKEQKKKRAAIEAIQSLVRKRVRSVSVPAIEDAANPTKLEQQTEAKLAAITPTAGVAHNEDVTAAPAPQDTADTLFNNIRTHYFDALYKSLGSLAYFAKGPLARARSAFHLDLESNLDMVELIEFLKSLILTTVQIDKKYRETIPDVVSKAKNDAESSDEGSKRRQRSKKTKIGKNGLYPLEDESVRKWWAANKPELGDGQTSHSAAQIKSHMSLLRTRETQLQMIIILEILALEPLKAAGENSLPQLPGLEPLPQQDQTLVPSPPQKKRNKHNLPVLVDVHADRLTIWQSTASDEQLLLEDSQVTRSVVDGQAQQKASSEPLRDFCVDVILPFFSARLPGLCDAINRKLGGPVILTPLKSKSSKRPSSQRGQKPGAAAKRHEQQFGRSVSRGPSNAIALLRSATSTSVSSVKREGSEPASLKTLPKGEPRPSQKPPALSRGLSMSNLEDAKTDKKAMVEAELKNAISALRKPNRDVVGRAMAEADQRRVLTSLSAKKKRMSRMPLAPSVQVKATPVNNRFRDVLGSKPEFQENEPLDSTYDLFPPSSIGCLVPSTGPRASHRDAFTSSASPAVELVEGTPMRPSTQASFIRRPANETPAMPPSSPIMTRESGKNPFVNDKAREAQGQSGPSMLREAIAATPVKRGAPRPGLNGSPGAWKEVSPKKTSIYKQLGWDDDFDELG